MFRTEHVWSGGPMGQGVSVLHFSDTEAGVEDLEPLFTQIGGFWSGIKEILPSQVTIQSSNIVQQLDNATGQLLQEFSVATPPVFTGAVTSSAYPGGVGGRVRWRTAGLRNGRRVTGTTFIVPLAGSMYDSSGTLSSTAVGQMTSSANSLRTGAGTNGTGIVVWSRPTTVGGSDGAIHAVDSVVVPDQASWLTSRRN